MYAYRLLSVSVGECIYVCIDMHTTYTSIVFSQLTSDGVWIAQDQSKGRQKYHKRDVQCQIAIEHQSTIGIPFVL